MIYIYIFSHELASIYWCTARKQITATQNLKSIVDTEKNSRFTPHRVTHQETAYRI